MPLVSEAEAGARFDAAMSAIRSAWAEFHTPEGEPFSVDGVVTPKAMAFFEGYCACLRAGEDLNEPPDAAPQGSAPQRPGP